MKLVVAICAALSVAIGSPPLAHAQPSTKHKAKKHARPAYSTSGGTQRGSARGAAASSSDWYPHDTSQLPFGSMRWWDQKARESGGDHN